jgi:hypothetical protein
MGSDDDLYVPDYKKIRRKGASSRIKKRKRKKGEK